MGDRETVTILEQESAYEVDVESPQVGSSYTVAKDTGEILSQMDSHFFEPPGTGEKRFEEFVG